MTKGGPSKPMRAGEHVPALMQRGLPQVNALGYGVNDEGGASYHGKMSVASPLCGLRDFGQPVAYLRSLSLSFGLGHATCMLRHAR
jgi:hypothetical protein